MMETTHLINALKDSEEGIFQSWQRHIRKAGYAHRQTAIRDDFHKTFRGVLSALEACKRETQMSLFVRPAGDGQFLVQSLVEEARLARNRGTDLEFFLGYFKTMISCIADRIPCTDLPREQITDAVRRLHSVADLTEMSIVADLKMSGGDEAGVMKRPMPQATSEKILSAIFMSVGEGILLVDEDFDIIKANQRSCEIFGLLQQNLIGMDIRSLTEETGAAVLTDFFDELFEGQRASAEISCLYVDGGTFPATVTVTRSDLDGKRYWPIIVRDNTDQRTLETQLLQEKQQTDEMNLTLKTVMKCIEQDRLDFENRVASKIRSSLLPSLKKIDRATEAKIRKSYLALLEEQLISLTAGFERELDASLLKLTKTEIEVCGLIQAGCSSKDICDAMKLSYETIQTHRKNIRRKLNLSGKKLNLHSFLMNRIL